METVDYELLLTQEQMDAPEGLRHRQTEKGELKIKDILMKICKQYDTYHE